MVETKKKEAAIIFDVNCKDIKLMLTKRSA